MHTFLPEPARTEHIAQIVVLLLACTLGADYLSNPPIDGLYIVERLIGPLPPWGAVFLFCGVMGLVGELWMEIGRKKSLPQEPIGYICRARNRWWPSFTAHVILCALYAGLFFGCLAEMAVNSHLYGLRVTSVTLMFAVWHGFFAQRRRHAP